MTRKQTKRRLSAVVIAFAATWFSYGPMARAEDGVPSWVRNTRLSGEVFADGYVMANNHNEVIEGANGFWFRRIDLTFDSKLNESFSSRLRFEVESKGDFTSNAALEPFIKNASLRWSHGAHALDFGLAPTPTWSTVEKAWGYRSVAKTPLDLQKLGGSRDMGLALKGAHADGKLSYRAMFGNGAGRKDEVDEGKKIYGSVGYHPSKSWVVEAYADHEARSGDTDRATFQGFVAHTTERVRVGVQYAHQNRAVEGADDLEIGVFSAFVVARIDDRVRLFARVDQMSEPNPDGDRIAYLPFATGAESRLVLLGVDVQLYDRVQMIPNVAHVQYEDAETGETPEHDLMVRLTVAWKF